MEQKIITVKFHKGIAYEIPATMVAKSRADYYACVVDGYDKDSLDYLNEVNYALEHEYELLDWIENNMNWSDLEPYAQRLGDDAIDLEKEWDGENYEVTINQ